MTLFTRTARDIFAPATESGQPRGASMAEVQVWGTEVERVVSAFLSNGGLVYQTRALMDADAGSYNEPRMAWVIGDTIAANNGIYRLDPVADAWIRAGDLPYSFIVATDIGAGTPNAIKATTLIPVSESALIILNIYQTSTGSPVTVQFNDGDVYTVKTNSGNDPVAGGLLGGMRVLGVVSGSTFRMVSDQASAAIVSAAEAAAAAAAASAELARKDPVVQPFVGDGTTTSFVLSVDPGSKNNITVNINGVWQLRSSYSYATPGGIPTLTLSEPVPEDLIMEVSCGYALETGVPGDGTVTTEKLAEAAVSLAKLAASATLGPQIDGAAAASFEDTDVLIARAADGSLVKSTWAEVRAAVVATKPRFRAKETANQTGIVSNTATKILFPSEIVDVGSYYNPATSRWTPPAGPVVVQANVHITGTLGTSAAYAMVYKNDALLDYGIVVSPAAGFAGLTVSVADEANGTDYYEIFVYLPVTSGTASTNFNLSRFYGYAL